MLISNKGKLCIWDYCNEICPCDDCIYCSHFRPNYDRDKQLLEDLRLEQLEQM